MQSPQPPGIFHASGIMSLRILLMLIPALLAGCRTAPMLSFGDGKAETIARAVAFSRDGQLLVAGLADGTLHVWDVTTGQELAQASGFDSSQQIPADRIAVAPDGRTIAFAGENSTVRIWNLFDNGSPRVLSGHARPIRQVLFAPDGVRLLTASGGAGADPKSAAFSIEPICVIAYHLESGQVVKRLDDVCPGGLAVVLAPDGETMACLWGPRNPPPGSHPIGQITIRDTRGGETRQLIESKDASILMQFSPDSQFLQCGTSIWDVQTGVRMRQFEQAPCAMLDARSALLMHHGIGTWFDLEPWFQAQIVDVLTGHRQTGPRVTHDRPGVFMIERGQVAPDGRSFVDYYLRQWRLPRRSS